MITPNQVASQLEHINLRVPSIAKVQALLCAAFPDYRVRGSGYGEFYGYWAHIGNDDHYVALLQRDKPGTENSEETIEPYAYQQPYRLMHLGFVVDDVDALMARMEAAGFQPDDVDNLDTHPHRRRVYYLDGNGIEYEFVQYLSDKAEARNDYSV